MVETSCTFTVLGTATTVFMSTLINLSVFLTIPFVTGELVFDLSNTTWQAVNGNGTIRVRGSVPGDVYTDLERAGLIGDPYFADNDVTLRWIARDNWTYSTEFDDPEPSHAPPQLTLLELDDLYAVARVWFNGRMLGLVDNQFRPHRYNVTGLLRPQANNLTVLFESAPAAALARAEAYERSYHLPAVPACPAPVQNGECHVNMLRARQSAFSWDWGPAFPGPSIGSAPLLRAYQSAVIRYVMWSARPVVKPEWETELRDGVSWDVWVTVVLEAAQRTAGVVQVTMPGLNVSSGPVLVTCDRFGERNVTVALRVPAAASGDPRLWWPAGHGPQPLYSLRAQWTSSLDTSLRDVEVGFRTVRLDQTGGNFTFSINGVSMFVKVLTLSNIFIFEGGILVA